MSDPIVIFLIVALAVIALAVFIGWLTNRKGSANNSNKDITGNEARLLGLLALLGKSGKK